MNNIKPLNFSSIEWGPDEAKNDLKLRGYFVPVPGYDELVQGSRRFVIGRKGTGKTAICERLKLDAIDNPLAFSQSLSLRNFPLNLFRELKDKSFRDKAQYVPAWTFLMATEFAKLVLQDQGARPREAIEDLQDFLTINFPQTEFGFTDTVSILNERQSKIQINQGWLSSDSTHKTGQSQTVQIHYQRTTDSLLDRLGRIETDSKYFLIIDELDEGYNAGDPSIRLLLLALLRAVEDLGLELGGDSGPFRPIAVLRSDIFDSLEDNDLNKLDDSILRLRWHASPTAAFSLRNVVNARINASVSTNKKDAWNEVVYDDDPLRPKVVDSVWSYMCTRTFERPRDIVKFLKICRKISAPPGRLRFATVREAENDYSRWLYQELGNELTAHLPVWKEALSSISRIGVGRFSVNKLKAELEGNDTVSRFLLSNNRTSESIIKSLFEFGVLGLIGKDDRWLFRYKDEDSPWNPRMNLIVHWGFASKLKLRPGAAL